MLLNRAFTGYRVRLAELGGPKLNDPSRTLRPFAVGPLSALIDGLQLLRKAREKTSYHSGKGTRARRMKEISN
jgi:hypothetical protein